MIQAFLNTARKGFNFGGPGGSSWGSGSSLWGGYGKTLPGAEYNYVAEAGNAWECGIVGLCLNWVIKNFPAAELKVVRKQRDGKWVDVPNHPVLDLFQNPSGESNGKYSESLLWSGLILSRMIDGNAYWYMKRNSLGFPVALYYIPHFCIRPVWPEDGNTYISGYRYQPLAMQQGVIFKPEEIFQSRFGVNPLNTRLGLSPIYPLLREVCTDNEAATAAAALMRNRGLLGMAFIPDSSIEGLDESTLKKFQAMAQEKFTGERRGQFIVPTLPGEFKNLGISPDEMAFDKVRKLPMSRVCGAFGISPTALGQEMERATFSNYDAAKKAAFQDCLCPTWDAVGDELTVQLLTLYGDDTSKTKIIFDYSHVPVLQPNKDESHKRVREDYKAQLYDRATALTELGMPVDPARDENVFYTPPASPEPDEDNKKPEKPPKEDE